MHTLIDVMFKEQGFRYFHSLDKVTNSLSYKIHAHDVYEMVIYLKGDSSFCVEGMMYSLNPYDIMISSPGEMHQIYQHSSASYERIVITFTESFFINNECVSYRNVFTERDMGWNNIIPGEEVKNSFIPQIISRMENYINEDRKANETVIKCAVIELLHNINRLTPKKEPGYVQNTVALNVSGYINKHLTEGLSLERLAEEFFISKYYLCHIFKKYFGMTVGQYITRKRILLAKKLYQNGQSLSEVALLSGFTDYSSFYKAFIKETGLAPKEGLKRFGTLLDEKKRL